MSSNLVTAKDNLEDSIEPYVITACPQGNGIHQCVSRGWGQVIKDGKVAFNGACWHCSNCYHAIVTEADPTLGHNIGRYASRGCSWVIPPYGATIEVTSIGYCNSKRLDGYSFRNNGYLTVENQNDSNE